MVPKPARRKSEQRRSDGCHGQGPRPAAPCNIASGTCEDAPGGPARDAGDGGAVVKDGIESHFVDLAFAEADAISARQNFEDV